MLVLFAINGTSISCQLSLCIVVYNLFLPVFWFEQSALLIALFHRVVLSLDRLHLTERKMDCSHMGIGYPVFCKAFKI